MTTIHQFIDKNRDIPREEIFKQLQEHKYLELVEIHNSRSKAVICVKPYTDIYLKPMKKEYGYFDYKQILVISKEAEEVMQSFCDDYRKKIITEKKLAE
ncbi:MAG: hypothetical protein K6B70_05185 [Clostridia bacterium]|nr:hypothetical protein [Clostridia bacterium]